MLTQEQFIKAHWYKFDYAFQETDDLVRPFLHLPIDTNWIHKVRTALFLSKESIAAKLGISRQAFARMEMSEPTINMGSLRKAAQAMDCELIYAIRPKEHRIFSERIWEMLNCEWPHNLYWIRARQYYPSWRKRHGWCRNGESIDAEIRQVINANRNGFTNSVSGGRTFR